MLWLLAALVLGLLWVIFIERAWFAVKTDTLAILPPGSESITVLHLSDIHMAPWQKRKQKWLKNLNLKPDLVINTGDNLGHKNGINPVLDSLKHLAGKGVYVNGSNDIYAPVVTNPFSYLLHPSKRHRDQNPESLLDYQKLNSDFDAMGWLNLNNRTQKLSIKGTSISFIGTDDPHEGRDDLSSLTKQKDSLVIGVTHAPYLRILSQLEDLGADVVFAGHTHGGQVCIPFIGKALVTNCDLPTKYARGLHKVSQHLWLNVCAGLGNSIYAPIRLACRPEVRVVKLVAKTVDVGTESKVLPVPVVATSDSVRRITGDGPDHDLATTR